MSSVSSAEPTAQQNFNPSWMRPNAANRGGSISSGGHRLSGIGGGGFDDVGDISSSIAAAAAAVLSSPVVSEFSYTRERLLELAPTGSIMPEALRDQLFFNEKNLPLVSNTPLSDLEQKLQHNINSSKAMSLLSHADRASIAAGAPYGNGYSGGLASASSTALQNGQSPTTNRWTPKSSWSKAPADRPIGATARGGSVGRSGGPLFAGRGGGRVGSENGFGGTTNGGSSAGQAEDSPGTYQAKFNALRRGGGAGSVGRGGSTTGSSFNSRADALYNPNDPTDRPKAVSTAVTRSESEDEEEEGWSKVGATSRSSTNTAPTSSERPAWARSESWIQRTQQQSSQQPTQPPISHWNNRESSSDSTVWKDRNQMVAAAKKTSSENPPSQPLSQQQPPSAPSTVSPREETDAAEHLSMPSYQPNSSTWSNNGMGGGMGVFYQPSIPAQAVKDEPVQFYYLDPSDTRRGPFSKEQMTMWFKAGYFTDETLRVRRGEVGEFKTIGELKKANGATTPFEYVEELEKPALVPTSLPNLSTFPSTANPLYPSVPFGGMNMWSSMVQSNEMMSMMQSTFEQQMLAERQRLAEEHNRRMQEEAEKMVKFQEAMYRQLSIQQELSQQQLREQEIALQRHREELEKRDAELKREALARQHKMEMEALELDQRKAAIEAEDRRKREQEQRAIQEEQLKKEAAEKLRRAEEAAEKERIRLEAASRESEQILRNNKLAAERAQREKEEEEKRKIAAEKERLVKEAAVVSAAARQQADLDAVWASKKAPVISTSSVPITTAVPKQVSPSGSDDSEGWTSISKEVKHTKAAPWASKSEVPQKSEKTLLEIQLEEERKLKAELDLKAKQKTKEQAAAVSSVPVATEKSGGLWGASKTWAAPESNNLSKSYVSPFLDGPSLEAANKMALQKKNSQAKIVVAPKPTPTVPSKSKVAPTPAPAPAKLKKSKQETAADELQQWFVKRFQQYSVEVDSLTLFDCILSLENPNEVRFFS
uniref:GYF domain-containing protein n=1 Tax=Caenorhabditis tropicalis TaxID=1561998 RepID=A0A1I7TUZ9_9PELO